MCEEAFVDGQESFGFDGFDQAVEDAAVEIARLVVHPRHYRIFRNLRISMVHISWDLTDIPGGCITQHTTNPLQALLARCSAAPSCMSRCFINLLFAKKYVGS